MIQKNTRRRAKILNFLMAGLFVVWKDQQEMHRKVNLMDSISNKQIERENRREAERTRGMGAGDWSVVLAAALLVAAVLGFIYMSATAGVPESIIEPASGAASAPAPAYDTETQDNTDNTGSAERPANP